MVKHSLIRQFQHDGKRIANRLFDLFSKGVNRKGTLLFFGAGFAFFWIYGFLHKDTLFVHDAMNYWQARNSFVNNGHFSLLNYNSALRGYLFPLLLFIIQWQANLIEVDAQLLFLTYSALFFAGLAFYLLPWFFEVAFTWNTPLIKRLLFFMLMFFFWRGHFLYPLTDFPALSFFLLSVGILVSIGAHKTKPLWAVLAGLAVGAAVNIRPVYQASSVLLLILLPLFWNKLRRQEAFLGVVFFLLGMGVILFPQLLVNRTHFQKNSPLVLSTYIEEENIYEIQLFWGLKTQKYETNIGSDYPFASVVYRDPLADKIPQRLLRDKTIAGYLNIIRSYPVEVAVSYFRHFFNGLDIFFSTPYVKKIHANHCTFSSINYLVWFLVVYFSLTHTIEKYTSLGVVLSMLAPVLLSVPLVVEVRFFLPLHILAYGVVSYGLNYTEMLRQIFVSKFRLVKFLCFLLVWMLMCFALSASTIEQLQS